MSVNKPKIAQAEQCVERLDWYDRALGAITTNLEIAKKLVSYNKLPQDFLLSQRKSIDIMLHDIKSMREEVSDMALNKAEKASDLRMERERKIASIAQPKKLVRNRIKCLKCGDVIESKSIHDYVSCSCGACSTDGGTDYMSIGGNTGDWEDLSEWEDVDE